jgi:hypothetical protein
LRIAEFFIAEFYLVDILIAEFILFSRQGADETPAAGIHLVDSWG